MAMTVDVCGIDSRRTQARELSRAFPFDISRVNAATHRAKGQRWKGVKGTCTRVGEGWALTERVPKDKIEVKPYA